MSRKTCSTCQSSLYLRAVCSAVSVVFVLSTHFPSYRASSSILAWLMATVSRSSFKYFQRLAKRQRIEAAICKKNDYLAAHERARVSVAVDNIEAMIRNLKIDSWLKVQSDQRMLSLLIDETALEEDSRLDGCYAIKTDLPKSAVSKEVVHGRYKDLALVELAFRTCKQSFLEIRPVYVRKEETTRGHVLVVMLAYMIVKQLRSAWADSDVTPEEGVKKLASLTCTKMEIKNMASCWKIPRPRKELKELLDALGVIMPLALPHKDINVDTRKKLSNRRKRNIVK